MRLTPRATRIWDMAKDVAAGRKSDYVGTEDVLVAIVLDGGGVGERALLNLGVTTSMLIAEVNALVGPPTCTECGKPK